MRHRQSYPQIFEHRPPCRVLTIQLPVNVLEIEPYSSTISIIDTCLGHSDRSQLVLLLRLQNVRIARILASPRIRFKTANYRRLLMLRVFWDQVVYKLPDLNVLLIGILVANIPSTDTPLLSRRCGAEVGGSRFLVPTLRRVGRRKRRRRTGQSSLSVYGCRG